MKIRGLTLLAMLIITTSTSLGAQHADHAMITPDQMTWSAGPASLPKGAEVAVLEGDPTKAGPFTIRLKFPANYRIQAHWHPAIEHVTVISGNLYMGMGDKLNEKQATKLTAGSFGYMQPKSHHFAFTHEPAVIQLHGIGPWGITYINAKDDPRNSKD